MTSTASFSTFPFSLALLLLATTGVSSSTPYIYNTLYIDTLVDHFSFSSNATFKLRYLINDTYWSQKANSPIFFYTGNEGSIETFAQNTGFMWEIAPDFKALIVFAEHRYYGKSMPFGDKSKENLGYLTSSQALMDFVELIAYLQSTGSHHNHPVIVFGGSYGGMLSAWIRLKYPAAVAGAIASSAPIWQFTGMTPCEAFNRVLTSAFKTVSPKCSGNIRKSWDAINDITKTDDGQAWLSSAWKLCSPLKTSDDVKNLKSYLNDVYANLAMVNYPYPSDFLAPLPGHPVKVFCKELIKEEALEDKKLLGALFNAVSVYFNYTGTATCLNYTTAYTTMDDTMWNYQACSEMIMPMCSDGKNDMFEPSQWNLTEFASTCYENYKVRIQANLVRNLYGGKDIRTASNIIFSNGLLDPWSSGGVLRNVSESALAVIIPDSAHHLDLRASNPLDPVDVTNARNFYRYTIQQWISEHRRLHM